MNKSGKDNSRSGLEIAIIGMSCRFPGANNIQQYWQNLRDGVESIRFFTDQEMLDNGVSPKQLADPNYVKASGVIEGIDQFDAQFFGINAREAEILDPQHRIFMECAWEALEAAGYDAETYAGLIGVYAGESMSTYLINLYSNPQLMESVGGFQAKLANDKDHLPTRVSYKLNLRGPSVAVQTACSTSLVAVHLACQALLGGECDMALAGGVSILASQNMGYIYQEGGVASPDGHCRPFDAKAKGTVTGNGAGIVVLKRLADAIADSDNILALIKGSAINNDGSLKVGYTAPSIEGQAEVIALAQEMAGVEATTISYIEAHGTGTALGDPIEMAALKKVFEANGDRKGNEKKGYCGVGSVKSNLGHLDAAAGVAGLIKVVEGLRRRQIPASLNYEEGNREIGIEGSPFYVVNELSEWKVCGEGARRAGVSSFGIGGTNAHVVLEEWEREEERGGGGESGRPFHLLLLSAKTPTALQTATDNLARQISARTDQQLADIAYTLQVGRSAFSHRQMLLCTDRDDALRALNTHDPLRLLSNVQETAARPIVFMFSGLGDHYVNMALGLYDSEPVFRKHMDYCAGLLKPYLGLDLCEAIYPNKDRLDRLSQEADTASRGIDLRKMLRRGDERPDENTERLNQTSIAQPALFAILYSLAQLWISWGIRPQAMIGYSLGEYVAACLAGVTTLEDALYLVARRAQLIQSLDAGGMLSVPLPEEEIRPLLTEELSISAINGPSLCVVSGPVEAITFLEQRLAERAVSYQRLQITHAFHSSMMKPIAKKLGELIRGVKLNAPQIPYISNVTGNWITDVEATDPDYWTSHLIQPVLFQDGIEKLWSIPNRILLEIGPGQSLSSLALLHPAADGIADRIALPSLRASYDLQPDAKVLLTTLGKLWLAGIRIDWKAFYAAEQRRRVECDTYPFERQRYWVELQGRENEAQGYETQDPLAKKTDVADWFYIPSWKQSLLAGKPTNTSHEKLRWLIFHDSCGIAEHLASRLHEQAHELFSVFAGDRFERIDERTFRIDPRQARDYELLITELSKADAIPNKIVHLWTVAGEVQAESLEERFAKLQDRGFYSLIFLAQALAKQNVTEQLDINVVSSNMQSVSGQEALYPEKATLAGACKVIPQEYTNLTCRSIDIAFPQTHSWQIERLTEQILTEAIAEAPDRCVAYRGMCRWAQTFEPVRLEDKSEPSLQLRHKGVYLITGGLGRIGLVLARYLAGTVQAKLVLVGRSAFPPREEWSQALASGSHDETAIKIKELLELEGLGAEVLVLNADVSVPQQIEEVVEKIVRRFGTLHGVIHAAGRTDINSMGPVRELDRARGEMHFRPKAYGLVAMEKALRGLRLDFCLLLSSLSPILGGLGLAAYSAANAFMDAFAQNHNQTEPTFWISVNWEGWEFEEAAANKRSFSKIAITPDESLAAFERLLSSATLSSAAETSQIILSVADIQARIDRWVKLETLRGAQDANRSDSLSLYARPNLLNPYTAPRTSVEQTLANIWQELLGTEPIGIYDNFFELGGHSLLATQFISRLRSIFNVDLSLHTFFSGPTIALLSEHIEVLIRVEQGLQSPPILPVERNGYIPLSFAQQRLWFFDHLETGTATYNLPSPVRLTGPLNIAALEKSLNEIIKRHEALRTNFAVVDGKPAQVISDEKQITLPVVDLTQLPKDQRAVEAERLVGEQVRQPFNLSEDLLIRSPLLRTRTDEHLMLLTMHHIVSDAWSIGVLIKEVTTLYESFSKGKPSPLPGLPIQYADFAIWQREWLRGDVLEAHLSYWRRQFEGELPTFELPTDHQRPALRSFHGASHNLVLPQPLAQKLKELSQQEGVTMFMTLFAAFNVLLYRYSNQEQIIVGTPIANRNRAETESLIGFFVNTLAVRTDLSGGPSFKEVVGRVREQMLGAYAHQDLPFEKLVEQLQPERSLSHNPLFQVMFILQNAPIPGVNFSGLKVNPLMPNNDVAKFDLTLSVEDSGQKLSIDLEYNTDLFEATTIERMAGHYATLLEAIADDCHRPVSDLPMLTPQEEQSFASWNQTSASLPQLNVDQLISLQAEARPLSNAVSCGDVSLCYQELNQRANQLAHYLQSRAIAAEQVVAVCLDRSIEQVVALLGVMKAGGAYLPIDPSYPPDRIRFMLDDSSTAFVITQQRLLDRLAPFTDLDRVDLLCIDSDWQQVARFTNDEIRTAPKPEQLAYLIYTSGTTGQPKAVEVEHHSLTNTIAACQMEFGFRSQDRWVSLASSAFDIWLFEVVNPLVSGAEVEIVEQDEVRDVERLIERMSGASVVHGVPSLMRQVVSHHKRSKPGGDESRLGGVRKVFVGGDEVSRELIEGMREVFGGADMRVLYGPTEAAIICASHEVGEEARGSMVGRAMKNVEIKICDRGGRRVPVGVEGEIYIGGEGVSRGYRGRGELTAQKYVEEEGKRFYRSGDRGRYREEGEIEYRGRGDEQVKVRGHRVEIGEVESAMMRQEGVRASAVVVEEEEVGGEKRLIGYVEMEEGREVKGREESSEEVRGREVVGREIRERLREELPEYEVPAEVVVVERMPMTAHGKVDKKALPGPTGKRPELETDYVPPQTDVEQAIAAIWREVLKVDKVGIYDNFFELGGHSLLALEVHGKLKELFDNNISMIDLFKYPTISLLAKSTDQGLIQQRSSQKSHDRVQARRASLKRRNEHKRTGHNRSLSKEKGQGA